MMTPVRVCPRCRSVYSSPVPWCRIDETPLVDQEEDPLVGVPLDRYVVTELIGVGGMGRVYRARHSVLDREYAIKVLFGEFASEEKFAERFRREAQAISRVRHPNIVSVEDFGQTSEGLVFLALEYVAGETLTSRLQKRTRLPPPDAASIIRQVVKGLGAAHARGLVHRDIKPQNLMLTRGDAVKILDFGAVNIAELPQHERLTTVGNIVGTPAYMAPEQSQNSNVGPEADFYSVGVVLYEMLTGNLPFRGRSRAEILVAHITEAAPPCPPSDGLERLVARLLEKRPTDRPASADEVLDLLDELPVWRSQTEDLADGPPEDRTDTRPFPQPVLTAVDPNPTPHDATQISFPDRSDRIVVATTGGSGPSGMLVEPTLEWTDRHSSIVPGTFDGLAAEDGGGVTQVDHWDHRVAQAATESPTFLDPTEPPPHIVPMTRVRSEVHIEEPDPADPPTDLTFDPRTEAEWDSELESKVENRSDPAEVPAPAAPGTLGAPRTAARDDGEPDAAVTSAAVLSVPPPRPVRPTMLVERHRAPEPEVTASSVRPPSRLPFIALLAVLTLVAATALWFGAGGTLEVVEPPP